MTTKREQRFFMTAFGASVGDQHGFRTVKVTKSSSAGDWTHIVIGDTDLVLHSLQELEQLHFTLGQLLRKVEEA